MTNAPALLRDTENRKNIFCRGGIYWDRISRINNRDHLVQLKTTKNTQNEALVVFRVLKVQIKRIARLISVHKKRKQDFQSKATLKHHLFIQFTLITTNMLLG